MEEENTAPLAVSDYSLTTTVDGNFNIQVGDLLANDSDADDDDLTIVSVQANEFCEVEINEDGSIFFIPAIEYSGIASFTYTVSDGNGGRSTATVVVKVGDENTAPIITTEVETQTVAEDEDVNFTIPATTFLDLEGNNLTYTASLGTPILQTRALNDGPPLPDWLNFNATTLTFTGTPPSNYNGPLNLKVTASDGVLESSAEFILNITAVNDAPVLENRLANQTFDEDSDFNFTIPANAFSDPEGTILTYSAGIASLPQNRDVSADGPPINPLPDWLSFNAETRTFTGSPPDNLNDELQITVIASDGELTASDTFTLVISPVNDSPDAVDDALETAAGTPLVLTPEDLLANDTDIEGHALHIYEVSSVSENGQVSFDGNQEIVYTPNAGFTGEDTFTYIIFDEEGGTSQATVTVTVGERNNAPVVANEISDQISEEDTAINFTIPADTFSDPDGNRLTYTAGLAGVIPQIQADSSDEPATAPLPEWLIFDAQTRTFSGTPPQNLNDSFDISVTASDGSLEVSDTFTLVITAVNDAPVLDNPLADQTSEEDTAVSFTIPADAFSDPEGTSLTYSATLAEPEIATRALNDAPPLPSWLTFNANTRTFSGTPPQDFFGSLNVTVTASDGELSESDTFTLEITAVNDGPEAVDDEGIEADAGDAQIISAADLLANDTDVDGDELTITSVNTTSGNAEVSLNEDGNVVYTASADFDGEDTFTYTISDGNGGTAIGTVSVSVEGDETDPYEGWQVGTKGRDYLYGDWYSSNRIYGDDGNDIIYGGARSDQIDGGAGHDRINGRWGDDIINGNDGNDKIWGSAGNDTINGGEGRDKISGGWGNDIINGDEGNDKLWGKSGNDTINGGDGNDKISGGWGSDTISGGEGNDQLWGGSGQDNFVFNSGDGVDTVKDFSTGYSWWWFRVAGDTITLDVDGIENYDDLLDVASQEGRHTQFDFGDDDSLTLRYTRLSSLDQDDFSFV